MITKDKGLLRNDVLKFLQKNKVAVVATASKDGIPEAATITYLFDDDFNFYFITRKQSQKLINLRKNPNVALVIGTDAKTIKDRMATTIKGKRHGLPFY
jgi:nitroimidazol reductase NimA-like FMN-containing flavoprotein (pyridoxamine 5'-phosphate oxidase superfamily)